MTLVEHAPTHTKEQISLQRPPHELYAITSSRGSTLSPTPLMLGLLSPDPGGTASVATVQRDRHDVAHVVQDEIDLTTVTAQHASRMMARRGSVGRMMALIPSNNEDTYGQSMLRTLFSYEPRESPVSVAHWVGEEADLDNIAESTRHIISSIRYEGGAAGYRTKEQLTQLGGDRITLIMTQGQLYAYRAPQSTRLLHFAVTHDFHAMVATDPTLFYRVLDEGSYRTVGEIPPGKLISFHEGYALHLQ